VGSSWDKHWEIWQPKSDVLWGKSAMENVK